MTGKILLIEGDIDRRWRLSQAIGRGECLPGGAADILFGDFDRARAEETAGVLRRNLPFNGLYVVRSGCEALEFLRSRGLHCEPERRSPPVLALLDEDLSGMAGHSILRSMLRLSSLGEILMIILVDAGRTVAHRQWTPEADGYLEKPFTLRKLRNFIRSLGAATAMTRSSLLEAPA
jgi:DNA-binding response OmpR family regulator